MITKNPPKQKNNMSTNYATQDLIKKLLFQQVEKPDNLSHVKIINVYDHKYRINLYCSYEENSLTKIKIPYSYFCVYNPVNKSLNILRSC